MLPNCATHCILFTLHETNLLKIHVLIYCILNLIFSSINWLRPLRSTYIESSCCVCGPVYQILIFDVLCFSSESIPPLAQIKLFFHGCISLTDRTELRQKNLYQPQLFNYRNYIEPKLNQTTLLLMFLIIN